MIIGHFQPSNRVYAPSRAFPARLAVKKAFYPYARVYFTCLKFIIKVPNLISGSLDLTFHRNCEIPEICLEFSG